MSSSSNRTHVSVTSTDVRRTRLITSQTFAKRDASLAPQLIAGIVVAVVGFNLIIAISWCIMKDRKELKKAKLHKRRISAPVDVEKYESSAAFAISTGADPAAIALKTKGGARGVPSGGVSYYELIRSLQQPAPQFTSLPKRHSGRFSRSSADSTKLKQLILRPQDMKDLDGVPYYPKSKQGRSTRQSVNLGVPTSGGLTRANSLSADTASVYSSASAPIEQHERLVRSQPFALQLETIPGSAPAWITDMPKPPTPAIVTDTTPVEFDVAFPSPTASTSESSEGTIVVHHGRTANRASPNSPSPISLPNSSMPTLIRTRTNSNPSAPPQIRWLTKDTTKDTASDTAPSSVRSKRPNSVSSLSTIFSLRESPPSATSPTITITPLNVSQRSHESQWGSIDLTRSSAPLVPHTAPAARTVTTAQSSAAPAVPKRSPYRPAPSASVEHLSQ